MHTQRYRHSKGFAHLLPFLSHENGAEGYRGEEGAWHRSKRPMQRSREYLMLVSMTGS